jgi:hypothetical protein
VEGALLPDSPCFFPDHERDANGAVDKGALAQARRRLHARGKVKKKRTSRGMRAFCVSAMVLNSHDPIQTAAAQLHRMHPL